MFDLKYASLMFVLLLNVKMENKYLSTCVVNITSYSIIVISPIPFRLNILSIVSVCSRSCRPLSDLFGKYPEILL